MCVRLEPGGEGRGGGGACLVAHGGHGQGAGLLVGRRGEEGGAAQALAAGHDRDARKARRRGGAIFGRRALPRERLRVVHNLKSGGGGGGGGASCPESAAWLLRTKRVRGARGV